MLQRPELLASFWDNLDAFVAAHLVVVDRPRGSAHPRYPDFIYPLDYGYLSATRGSDGSGVDVWVGNLPARQVTGLVCTVDLLKDDLEIKLLLGCSAPEMQAILRVHNDGGHSAILIERPETA